MTVQELLDLTNALYPNAESTDNKVKFMNIALRSLSPCFGLTAEDDSLYTIADQDEYAFPTGLYDVSQIIVFAVGNRAVPANRYDYTKYAISKRDDDPMRYNSFWQIMDSTGAKKIALYPIPSETGLPIVIRYHKKLTEMSSANLSFEPEFDSQYHDMLALYCVHMICSSGASPDDIQANAYMQKYDDRLNELWKNQMEMDKKRQNHRRDNKQWHRGGSFGRGF